MEQLTAPEVVAALTEGLGKELRADLSRDDPAGRITGWIVHPAFQGVSRVERQQWLWDGYHEEGQLPEWKGLRNVFRKRHTQIGMLFTFSPQEYALTFAEAA